MRKFIPIILSLALVFSACGKDEPKQTNEQQTVEQLMARIGELESQLSEIKKENENLKSGLGNQQNEINDIQEQVDANTENSTQETKSNSVLGIEDEWVVDGQWKLKILDVKRTQNRNEYADTDPAEVVIVSYTYENLGYENEYSEGLYLAPEQIIDEQGSVGHSYPGEQTHYPDEISAGSKVDIAEAIFGINNASNEVTVNFAKHDSNGNNQKASFKVPVN